MSRARTEAACMAASVAAIHAAMWTPAPASPVAAMRAAILARLNLKG